jgi:hypothetical protein
LPKFRRAAVRSPFKASSATRALKAASWFLRFGMSVLRIVGDQQTSNRSFRQCPVFGGYLRILRVHTAIRRIKQNARVLLSGLAGYAWNANQQDGGSWCIAEWRVAEDGMEKLQAFV